MNLNNVQGPPPAGPNIPAPDLRPMEELLQAPTDGVGDAIVVPPVLASQFELKIGLLNLVTAISFHGFENDDPHSHIRRFTKITQTIKLNQVPHDVIKLILFPFSLEGAARTWLEKEPPNSITTWNDLVKMDNPNITMEEYVKLEEEKARKRGKVFNWETTKYGKIWYDEDVHDLRSVETEFLAIFFNDKLTSEEVLS
ncbi:hypothetical protein Tco_0610199 [Tanacetum coccineum]